MHGKIAKVVNLVRLLNRAHQELLVVFPPDFHATCPTGPHISPRLIPINPNGGPNNRAADSPFGSQWEYLSRPFVDGADGWNRTTKDVKAYLRHLQRVLEIL